VGSGSRRQGEVEDTNEVTSDIASGTERDVSIEVYAIIDGTHLNGA
jgi:hypothetical protein